MNQTKKVLLADDELSIRRLFEIGLRDVGFDITTVKTGLEAVERLKKEHYDLFIVDLRMPGIDGFTTVERIRHFKPDLPVILQGSFKNEESQLRAEKLGIVEYFTKPFEWTKMVEAITRILAVPAPAA